MKKIVRIVALAFVVIMLLGLCACANKSDVVGVWRREGTGNKGTVYTYLSFSADGVCITLHSYADYSDGSEPYRCTWEYDGKTLTVRNVHDNKIEDQYLVEGGNLCDFSHMPIYEKISDNPNEYTKYIKMQ